MAHPYRYILALSALVVTIAVAPPTCLQAQGTREVTVREAGTVANVFDMLDPNRPLNAIRVTIPEELDFQEVRLLRYGTEPIPVRVRRTKEPGAHLFVVERPLTGPHDLLLRLQLPDAAGTYDYTIEGLVRETRPDSVREPQFRTVDRRARQVTVEAPSDPDRTNRALSLESAAEPLLLRADAMPSLGQTSSFTIEFWLRTNGLDEIVLSTWNGNESVAYPAEFVVDRGGRLRFYSGRPGNHQALRTGRPVADGQWHHAAAVYDARRSRLRLLLDGVGVDSLRAHVLPPAPGPIPLAVGGRVRERAAEADHQRLFSGHLDELRIWGKARSIRAVQRLKGRSLRQAAEGNDEQSLVRLGFETEETGTVEAWPTGARRVPATLSFRSSLRNLRAQTNGRTVTLRWTADAADVKSFVVERSSGGQSFTEVANLDPAEARRTTVSEIPEFTYTDEGVSGQVVFYRIHLNRADGGKRTSGTIKIGLGPEAEPHAAVQLIGNFPNPFAETTTVAFEVNEATPVTITVWDLAGHRIAQLADGMKRPGYHEASFEATDLPSGTYFVRLETATETQTHRMVVLK